MARYINNHVLSLALVLVWGVSAARAQAPATGSPAGNKVGIVSIQDAIANTNEGKKELDALQQKFAPRNAALQSQNEELESLQRSAEDFQNEVQTAEQEILNRLGKKMLDVLEKYARANGYAVVMDVSNPQTPVLYANPGTNITKPLIEAYNAASPVAAPAAKPA